MSIIFASIASCHSRFVMRLHNQEKYGLFHETIRRAGASHLVMQLARIFKIMWKEWSLHYHFFMHIDTSHNARLVQYNNYWVSKSEPTYSRTSGAVLYINIYINLFNISCLSLCVPPGTDNPSYIHVYIG